MTPARHLRKSASFFVLRTSGAKPPGDRRIGDGSRVDAEGGDASAEMVECWYWRYRDPGTGQVCVSDKTMTAEEASSLPEAGRIESSRTLRGTGEEDTTPDVFRTGQAPLT